MDFLVYQCVCVPRRRRGCNDISFFYNARGKYTVPFTPTRCGENSTKKY